MQRDRVILDNLSTGIMALDGQLQVVALNAAGQAMLEASEARCLGQHAGKLVLQPGQWLDNLEQALALAAAAFCETEVPAHQPAAHSRRVIAL